MVVLMITDQQAFCIQFQHGQHEHVLDRKIIQVWVSNSKAKGSALKRKPR